MATEEKTFSDFKFNKQLLNAIADMGFTKPSPIQEKAIPRILAGQDLFGIAQTGTGKTAAFVLPILMKIKYAQGNDPRALILAPTRELVIQIDREINELAKYTDLRHVCVYGGIGPKTQIEEIQKGVDILVGTPGRVMDIYLKGELNFKQLKVMVLDEADRMMDMGFMPQIRKFLEIIPRKRQNLLFSATLPDKVVTLSEEFLEFPERIEVTPQATPAKLVEQKLYYVPNFLTKINLIGELLKDEETFSRVIIFTKSKENADNIYKFLSRKGKGETKVLHANKGQNSRINAIDSFKDGTVRTLVATDVASRGIDVSGVTHVINFDVPIIYEDYVHRIGRTGRANNTGIALTFCNPAEKYHIEKIQKVIRMQIPVENLPSTLDIMPTPVEERQKINKEIDHQKRREDPDFKGAFHEKKGRKKDSPYLIALNKKKKSGNRRNKKRR